MASRPAKHEHAFRIISHAMGWQKALVMCSTCTETQVWTRASHRVQIAPRKYRDQYESEFLSTLNALEHLCCHA